MVWYVFPCYPDRTRLTDIPFTGAKRTRHPHPPVVLRFLAQRTLQRTAASLLHVDVPGFSCSRGQPHQDRRSIEDEPKHGGQRDD